MRFLDYLFNLIECNRRGWIVRVVQNSQNLEIEFGLRKLRTHDNVRIDIVQFFDIFIYDVHIQCSSHLVGGDNNSFIVRAYEIGWNIIFDVLKKVFMLAMWTLACNTMILMLLLLISMMICFVNSSLVVILILGLPFVPFLSATFYISMILPGNNLNNASLIFKIYLILFLVAWVNKWFFR